MDTQGFVFTHQEYMTDAEVVDLYLSLAKHPGILRTVFYERSQRDNPEAWLAYVRDSDCWLCRAQDACGMPLGAFWLDMFRGHVARFHFFALPAAWGASRGLAEVALPYVAAHIPDLSGLIGELPARNRLAWRYAYDCGFRPVGTIPRGVVWHDGLVDDLLIFYMSLEGLR